MSEKRARVARWLGRFVRRCVIRLQILANEITYFADLHHCGEISRSGRNTDALWCEYRTRWMARSMELHQKLHALSSPNAEMSHTAYE